MPFERLAIQVPIPNSLSDVVVGVLVLIIINLSFIYWYCADLSPGHEVSDFIHT